MKLVNELEFEFIYVSFTLLLQFEGFLFTMINISCWFFVVHFNDRNWYTKIILNLFLEQMFVFFLCIMVTVNFAFVKFKVWLNQI